MYALNISGKTRMLLAAEIFGFYCAFAGNLFSFVAGSLRSLYILAIDSIRRLFE